MAIVPPTSSQVPLKRHGENIRIVIDFQVKSNENEQIHQRSQTQDT